MIINSIYDNGPMTPVVKWFENISPWTNGTYEHYRTVFVEPLPMSSPMTVDFVALSGNVSILANGTIQATLVQALQAEELELYQLRFEPVDDVECILWQKASKGRFAGKGVHARVSPFTKDRDPWLATSSFWVMGKDRDFRMEIRNPNPVLLPQARVNFWGYRFVLEAVVGVPTVTTYLPAEGR